MLDRRIRLRHIQAFVEIIRQGSLKRAAEALFLTQPAISRTIAELEEIAGARLMTRSRRGVTLTPQGEFFHDHALNALAALSNAMAGLSGEGEAAALSLRAGALPSVAARLMPEIRARIGMEERKVGHFEDGSAVLDFVDSTAMRDLAALGTSCPDHFLRTKIRPLVLDFDPATRNLDAVVAGLDAALAAFQRGGVTASLDDIAKAAGVGAGTLYRHFPSRDDLVLAVIDFSSVIPVVTWVVMAVAAARLPKRVLEPRATSGRPTFALARR